MRHHRVSIIGELAALALTCIALAACGKDGPTYSGPPIGLVTLFAPSTSVIVGEVLQLSVELRDVNGNVVTTAPVQWSSGATAIASVSQGGRVTGRTPGSAKIFAASGAVRDSVEIIVTTDLYDVITTGEIFIPASLSITVGTTVRFLIFGDEHDVEFTKLPGAPADIPVVRDVIVPRTFNVAGTFPYVCNVHPGMVGQIVVQ